MGVRGNIIKCFISVEKAYTFCRFISVAFKNKNFVVVASPWLKDGQVIQGQQDIF